MSTGHATHLRRQTFMAKNGDVERVWRHADAEGVPLGRLASEIAVVLMGKHRPEYTPHVDTGDFVIVTNATKVGLSGKKATEKFAKTYTGYPGGLKLEAYGSLRERKPERAPDALPDRASRRLELGSVVGRGLHDEHRLLSRGPARDRERGAAERPAAADLLFRQPLELVRHPVPTVQDQDVLVASRQVELALPNEPEVAGVEPAVAKGVGRGVGIPVVAGEDARASREHAAHRPLGERLPVRRTHDADLGVEHRRPHAHDLGEVEAGVVCVGS